MKGEISMELLCFIFALLILCFAIEAIQIQIAKKRDKKRTTKNLLKRRQIMDFNTEKFLEVGKQAVWASMQVIRPYILGQKDYGDIEIKEHDQTLVTAVDRMSEEAATPILQKAFPDIPIIREEGGTTLEKAAPWIMWFDGLDGTNLFTIGGSGSTVILVAYDCINKEQLGAIVGEPSTGRIWSACINTGCTRQVESNICLCKAWNNEKFEGKTVLLDVSHGFPRGKGEKKRQILTEKNMDLLLKNLRTKVKVLLLGSNGLHHALVANGNQGMIGCITTAMGGPWDTPTLLGVEAGGFGQSFRMSPDRKLIEQDVLDPESYDMAIMAGSQPALDFLSDCLSDCMSAG